MTTEVTTKPLTAGEISKILQRDLSQMGSFSMSNVYVKGSPWESDVIRVLKSGYWHEYEIKLSVADYQADFRKKTIGWNPKSPRKHDFYQSGEDLDGRLFGYGSRSLVPRPATFHFVTPVGLLDGVDIPDHCGLIEVQRSDRPSERVRVVKKAPRLKGGGNEDTNLQLLCISCNSTKGVR